MSRPDMTPIADRIAHLLPCDEAVTWLGDRTDLDAAWAECPRADWMVWLLGRTRADRRLLALVACDIARAVLHLVPEGEDRPRLAIEAAEAWTRCEATREEVMEAATAIDDAADAAARAASRAAWAAVRAATAGAAGAAGAAWFAVGTAVVAAKAAADAAGTATVADAARSAARSAAAARAIADIVRARFPYPPALPDPDHPAKATPRVEDLTEALGVPEGADPMEYARMCRELVEAVGRVRRRRRVARRRHRSLPDGPGQWFGSWDGGSMRAVDVESSLGDPNQLTGRVSATGWENVDAFGWTWATDPDGQPVPVPTLEECDALRARADELTEERDDARREAVAVRSDRDAILTALDLPEDVDAVEWARLLVRLETAARLGSSADVTAALEALDILRSPRPLPDGEGWWWARWSGATEYTPTWVDGEGMAMHSDGIWAEATDPEEMEWLADRDGQAVRCVPPGGDHG